MILGCGPINRMAYEYAIVREVEFHHTDMAGIMHFSNFYRFQWKPPSMHFSDP